MVKLVEIAKLFLKLGTIGFGGPAVHIAMMQEEVVNLSLFTYFEQSIVVNNLDILFIQFNQSVFLEAFQ